MNKSSLRAFAFGVFFSVSLIGSYYSYSEKKQTAAKPTTNEAENLLKEKGYTILTETEYEQLQTQIKQAKESNEKDKQPNKSPVKKTSDSVSYDLYIVKGMTITQIAEQLANKKIIDNEKDFEHYLIKNNYHTKVQIGTFTLTNNMNYKKIAEAITK
ncbi:endolytic transglycosylase MltG [Niallia sp. 01092]|uniref:endolytic transglycosylase MltG n=1 Tax=unclassified Niallia TaxID=2837522 RepID=UPI003FD5AE74